MGRRGGGDDAGAHAGRPLGQDETHPAGTGVQQHHVIRLYPVHRVDQKVRCHPFQQRRGGDVGCHRVWHGCHQFGWRNAVFGVCANSVGAGNSIADTQCRDSVAHRGDCAGHLGTQNERELMWIEPGPEIGVNEVHAYCLGFDQHLTTAGRRWWLLHVAEDSRIAGLAYLDGMHTPIATRSSRPVDSLSDNTHAAALVRPTTPRLSLLTRLPDQTVVPAG